MAGTPESQDSTQSVSQDSTPPESQPLTRPASQILTRLLIDNGFSLSGKDLNKGEALVWAVKRNKERLVHLLLDEGADVNYKRVQGSQGSACHAAAWGGFCDILVLLHKAGADISATDKFGQTPLHSAASRNKVEVVRLLITTLGAPVTCVDGSGWTPLHLAARSNSCGLLQWLHETGTDIEQPDRFGHSALQNACQCGALDAAKALIAMGANIEWTTGSGSTALHIAAFHGKPKIV